MELTFLIKCIYWLNILFAIYIMVRVILNNRNPAHTVAWALVLLFVPLLGLVLYFFFGRDTRRRRYINKRLLSQLQQNSYAQHSPHATTNVPSVYRRMVDYFENTSYSTLLSAYDAKIITDGRQFLEVLLHDISEARHHIHMMFYIFENDEVGCRVRDALVAKAREGVEVRIIYDSVGCWSVPVDFYDDIRRAGGYVVPFLKVRFPLFTNKVNYRNHRKVVVIDGKIGFVGGFNIADRYVKGCSWGRWRDTMLRLRGSVVHALQGVFLMDWYFADRSQVSGKYYFPVPDAMGNIPAQVVTSTPVGRWRTVMNAYIYALSQAKSYIYMQTPYLMPNEQLISMMQNAALSGVDVRLMIPLRSDSKLTDYASYSYVGELLEAGVKIYLYREGFVHAKTFVSDDMLSIVGSANIDFRSFYYNFEVCTCIYDDSTAKRLKNIFYDDIKLSYQLTMKEFAGRSWGHRCMESLSRLLSPIL